MYFYCQSYLAFNFALSQKDCTVITTLPEIVKACNYLNIKVIIHQEFSLSDYLFRRKKIQKEINHITDLVQNSEFHFSHDQFALFCFILVQKLISKNKKVIFHDYELKFLKTNRITSIRSLLYRIICKVLHINYSIPLEIRSPKKNNYVISLNTASIQQLKKINYAEGEYNTIVENTMLNFKLKQDIYSNIFIDQGLASSPYISNNLEEIAKIKNILSINNFSIKEHPIHTNKSLFENFNKMPNYLPVEIFFNTITGPVVSIYSHALIIASRFKDINAISLIYLITDEEMKNKMIDRLKTESNNKITFIYSHEEFEKLLAKN